MSSLHDLQLHLGRRVPSLRPFAAVIAIAGLLMTPVAVSAHPLGNFTINHYSGIRVEPDRVLVDHVMDYAEIPTFQERQAMDRAGDGDGTVSDAEVAAYRDAACARQASALELVVGGDRVTLDSTAAAVRFPPGQAGAPTLRLVCALAATLPARVAGPATVSFSDGTYAERVGWREIVVVGDRTAIGVAPDVLTETRSARLTAYPADLLAAPLDARTITFEVAAGGPALAPYTAPELPAVAPAAGPATAPGTGVAGAGAVPAAVGAGAGAGTANAGSGCTDVTGGLPYGTADLGQQVCELIQAPDLTPGAIIISMLVAAFLGAAHAVSPGHGKTVMAAYLVGARGGLRHAVGLGLTVTLSHTLGVLGLGAITIYASTLLPPDKLQLFLGVASGLVLVALGIYLVVSRLRGSRFRLPSIARARGVTAGARLALAGAGSMGTAVQGRASSHDLASGHGQAVRHGTGDDHDHAGSHGHRAASHHEHSHELAAPDAQGHSHDDAGSHDHESSHDHDPSRDLADAHPHPHDAEHGHDHPHPHEDATDAASPDDAAGWHSHGVFRHTHVPEKLPDGGLSWRALFALGLSGGLVPSASAVIVLLVSISLGRPGYGIVLTVAFGLGMAVVLIGIGIALVYARGLLERMPRRAARLAGAMRYVPMLTAVFVLVVGVAVTAQAFGQLR